MSPDKQRIQQYLKAYDFTTLFREELGWDTLKEAPVALPVDGQIYTLRPFVEKRGFKVYLGSPTMQGQIPSSASMHQIERELTKHAYEHLIIYTDGAREEQAWQWVKREPGKPSASRLYRLHKGQSGELLSQKLLSLAFSIEEEDQLGTAAVAARVRQALDTERVTKKFYERFQKEHTTFLTFIDGIAVQSDCEWYASLMLNRLMFVYFIQKKGLLATSGRGQLDGDVDYLSHKLTETRQRTGEDQFYSFYRYFLLRLFHEGLGGRERSPELEQLLGNVPYLNGGLFDVHQLERDYPDIQIADEAFERIFAFFDDYRWHLDERPLRNDREINPDVLGYIFEKYINQRQMGAYYTKEDITGYISKNTVISCLLEKTEQKCSIAFTPDGFVWSLLRRDPDRYIYEAVKHGCDLLLPPEIEVGIHDVSQRGEWNKAAPEAYALPTEIWREVVARRTRYEEVRATLASGTITHVNDLITFNLDLCQFARDIIAYSEGVDLLNAFYASLETITILDPTCGSGAFLFAALNILEPLYEACLDRMQEMVAERDRLDALETQQGVAYPGSYIPRFRDILGQVAKHPNRRYFILKSIIINNLYGVDIMEEAVEICKLRLFLKLVAQIGRFPDIEPLPDIDFNIQAGNTLVGFATYAEAERTITSKLDFDNAMTRIEQKAVEVEQAFHNFRSIQTAINVDPEQMAEMKQQVRSQLSALNEELDRYLAGEYGIDRTNILNKAEYEERFTLWRQSHQPFHWFVEFYSIMKRGGFDVIVGNPPYVEYKHVWSQYSVRGYMTESCGDLYAFTMERATNLVGASSRLGMIVPVSIVSTDGFRPLRELLERTCCVSWNLCFAERPSKLFTGVEKRLTIWLASHDSQAKQMFVSKYRRWFAEERDSDFSEKDVLFSQISFVANAIKSRVIDGVIPKIASSIELSILGRLLENRRLDTFFQRNSTNIIYYTRKLRYFVQFFDFIPRITDSKNTLLEPSELKEIYLHSLKQRDVVIALLNSNLFFWFFNVFSDVRNVNRREIDAFRCSLDLMELQLIERCIQLKKQLMEDFKRNSRFLTNNYGKFGVLTIQSFQPRLSKPIIDEIDHVLARHYRFTDEELDFIINYDIKYRMGRSDEEDEGE